MDFQFMPLELWRASSLQQETKTVLAAYERCLAAADIDGLSALREAIERRIDELEAFYTQHYDDERASLFDKQGKKLRKLLHEYDAAVASLGGGGGSSPSRHQGLGAGDLSSSSSNKNNRNNNNNSSYSNNNNNNNNNGGFDGNASNSNTTSAVRERHISENSRLRLEELAAWFTQAGQAEMPGIAPDLVERVFRAITRTNMDGKMSVKDLRQWYISYGKPALKMGLKLDAHDLVPTALVKPSTVAVKEAAGKKVLPPVARGLYAWEDQQQGSGAGAASAALSSSGAGGSQQQTSSSATTTTTTNNNARSSGPIGLPNAMVEFQIRMTAEEYRIMSLRRRQYESELKFRERIEKAHVGPNAFKHTRTKEEEDSKISSLRESPFVDPGAAGSYLFRASVQ